MRLSELPDYYFHVVGTSGLEKNNLRDQVEGNNLRRRAKSMWRHLVMSLNRFGHATYPSDLSWWQRCLTTGAVIGVLIYSAVVASPGIADGSYMDLEVG
jgi:hypothetical protein